MLWLLSIALLLILFGYASGITWLTALALPVLVVAAVVMGCSTSWSLFHPESMTRVTLLNGSGSTPADRKRLLALLNRDRPPRSTD